MRSKWATLAFEAKGTRRSASFVYADSWLTNSDRFALSPDLPLVTGYQFRANKDLNQSAFFGCFADIEPDGWGAWSSSVTMPNNAGSQLETDCLLDC